MTAAFILGINMFIGAIFAVAFGVVSATNRTARGAGWLAAGYALGMVYVALEFELRWQADPVPVSIGIYLAFLAATTCCLIGVAQHYRLSPPRAAITAIWIASLVTTPVIFTLPYGSGLRTLLYQLPYAVMQFFVGWVIFRSRQRQPLDLLLMALSSLAALLYLLKPAVAWFVGTARTPQDYMASTYAAISQSSASVTLIALALVLLLVMMRDATAEMAAQSQTDPLSGVLNRRGLEVHGAQMLAEAQRQGKQLTLITADLDHFKAVNDTFGHTAGDEVIVQFAARLSEAAGEDGIVARLGGEEFAVLLAKTDLSAGRRFAEALRQSLSTQPLLGLGIGQTVTASFGVAQMASDDTLYELSHRSDTALCKAKAGGRDRVHLALKEAPCSSPATKFIARQAQPGSVEYTRSHHNFSAV
ncbi:GGDEF domain-containing protein [Altererythrobacter sp. TH136]|nr:GGDEF domain-containing protein [Altererythrobacter sp. TH136]